MAQASSGIEDRRLTFLLESYKAYVDYYRAYIDGMWVRFNTLLTVNVALAGFYGTTLAAASLTNTGSWLIRVIGLLLSLLLYAQSAQERYIVKRLREIIYELRKTFPESIGAPQTPTLFAPLDEIDKDEKKFIKVSLVSWRSAHFSITRLPAIISLVFVGIWAALMFIPISTPPAPNKLTHQGATTSSVTSSNQATQPAPVTPSPQVTASPSPVPTQTDHPGSAAPMTDDRSNINDSK